MVFKDNIIPYSFKVRSYTKIVTNILIYNGWYADSVTNRHEEKFSVESYETDQMDTIYQCYNAVKMTKDGLTRVYVDRDGVNITVNLKPTGGLANGVRRYASQTELYDAPGWLIWTYRTRTTVNCLITDTDGLYLTYDSDRPLILLYKGRGWVFKDLYALLYLHLQMRDDSA